MRRTLFLLLFAFGCASSSPLIEKTYVRGAPGQPIVIAIGATENPLLLPDSGRSRNFDLIVEITNVSDFLLTIDRIHVANGARSSRFDIRSMKIEPNQPIEPGAEAEFILSARIDNHGRGSANRLAVRTAVTLSNGTTYAHEFEIPGRP